MLPTDEKGFVNLLLTVCILELQSKQDTKSFTSVFLFSGAVCHSIIYIIFLFMISNIFFQTYTCFISFHSDRKIDTNVNNHTLERNLKYQISPITLFQTNNNNNND